MTKPKKKDYEVGYAKPPKDSQFQKGESGNPRGRPKGRRNHLTMLYAAMNEPITITENNKRTTVTKFEAVMKQIMNQALKGNGPVARLVITHLLPLAERIDAQQGNKRVTSVEDQQVVKDLFARNHKYGRKS